MRLIKTQPTRILPTKTIPQPPTRTDASPTVPTARDDSNATASATPQNGWDQDKQHWYENGQAVHSKFFYDNESDAWYWAEEDSSIACNKDVFVPDSNTDRSHGKWVRFDGQCRIVKGEDYRYGAWYYFDTNTGEMAKGITHMGLLRLDHRKNAI